MKLPPRLLFVGAHCDDLELFAGGLLHRACRERREVGVLVFSDHRGVVSDEDATRARGELAQNLAWLAESTGTRPVDHTDRLLGACDGSFDRERGYVYAALESVRERYDLVVTHAESDTNQDHHRVAMEAKRVFKAHATVLSGEFPNNDCGEFAAAVYVALDAADVAAKDRLIGTYASQRRNGRPYLDATLARALARVRGAQIRAEHAEAFAVLARVVVRA